MKLTKRQKRYAMYGAAGAGALGLAAAGGFGIRQVVKKRKIAQVAVKKGVKKVNDLIAKLDREAMARMKTMKKARKPRSK